MESKPLVKSLSFWGIIGLVVAYSDPISATAIAILPDAVDQYVPWFMNTLATLAAAVGIGGVATRKTTISGLIK